jgi:protein farnesyltransferase/geranylgeranyltransferase type-1 subunit alpha
MWNGILCWFSARRVVLCCFVSSLLAHELIQEDPRNNSAWNQRWFAVHRGRKQKGDDGDDPIISLELARHEADYAIHTGATLDPFNESPWRYLIGLLKELPNNNSDLYAEYEAKAYSLRAILSDAHRDPETCSNLTSARIDLLEMIGDDESLEKVSTVTNTMYNSCV